MSFVSDPIPNASLSSNDLPAPDAPWPERETFALTFNGYWALGDDACGSFANWVKGRFNQRGDLPWGLSLTALRSCLFFEQRRYRHFGFEPPADETPYLDALLMKIAERVARPKGARGAAGEVERHAMEVVQAEEIARGREPRRLSKAAERREGCDLQVRAPALGPSVIARVEVKGWGGPLLGADGGFRYGGDVNREQYQRALADHTWRLEIVANLTAAQAVRGPIERLTLTAADVRERAAPWKYTVDLDGLQGRISRPSE